MRAAILFAVAFFAISPVVAYAALPPFGTPKEGVYIGDKDRCLDETISLKRKAITSTRSADPDRYATCKDEACDIAKEKAKSCVCGKVTFGDVSGKPPAPISKCDPRYATLFGQALSGKSTQADIKSFALQFAIQDAIDGSDVSQYAGALQAFGVSSDDAQRLVKTSPEDAANLLKAFATGDRPTIVAVAKSAGVSLNTSTLDDITNLTPGERADKFSDLYTDEQKQQIDAIMSARTGFGTEARGGRPPQQVLSRDILNSGQGACYYVNNRYASTNACLFSAAQIEQMQGNIIPMVSSVYCLQGAIERTAYGGVCDPNGFNAASKELPPGTRVLVFNPQTGLSAVVTINDRGPFVPGRDLDLTPGAARAIGFGGLGALHTVVLGPTGPTGALGQMASVGEAFKAYQDTNGTIAVGDGNISPGQTRSTSPFGGLFGPSTAGYVNTTSPFANVSPAFTGFPAYSGFPSYASMPAQGGIPALPSSPSSVAQPVSATLSGPAVVQSTIAQNLLQALLGTTSTSTASSQIFYSSGIATGPLPPVATLIVQPHSVVRGNTIVVSWSSIGMKSDAPCRVLIGDVFLLAQGNEGTRRIPTDQSTPTSTMKFSLECTKASGESLEQRAFVMVQ